MLDRARPLFRKGRRYAAMDAKQTITPTEFGGAEKPAIGIIYDCDALDPAFAPCADIPYNLVDVTLATPAGSWGTRPRRSRPSWATRGATS